MMLMSAGKKQTIPPITATHRRPRPNIKVRRGARATSGIDRRTIAIGMNVWRTVRCNMKMHDTARPRTIPAT